ncbi:MAG: sigma 54-interacting transcriptional regulator [Acidobacteriota bacterium]|nr:sigma 54-interacting transcriptional regulator [Acidobacteriota bacterium]
MVLRNAPPGRPVSAGRVPETSGAALFLQAASALAALSAAGTWASAQDLLESTWDGAGAGARLWLPGTPAGVSRGGAPPPPSHALSALLERLFRRRGRVQDSDAAQLLARLAEPGAGAMRPDFWVAAAYAAFPSLAADACAEARLRTIGSLGTPLLPADRRGSIEKARAILAGRDARLLEPGSPLFERARSSVAPGLRICVGIDAWDPLVREAVEAEAAARPGGAELLRIPASAPPPALPDEWRSALFVPCGGVAASLRFYERLSEIGAEAGAASAAIAARRIVADPGWAPFASDLTGYAPLPHWQPGEHPGRLQAGRVPPAGRRILEALSALGEPCEQAELEALLPRAAAPAAVERMVRRGALSRDGAGRLRTGPNGGGRGLEPARRRALLARWLGVIRSPARRIGCVLALFCPAEALVEAARLKAEAPGAAIENWFEMSARLSAAVPAPRPAWLEAIEAERELSGGRAHGAQECLGRILSSPAASEEERRAAALRRVEIAGMRGRPTEAAELAGAWRRAYPGARAGEQIRALRVEASGASRLGEHERALRLLDDAEAEARAAGLPEADRLETALVRAGVLSRAGRFEEEAALYASSRGMLSTIGDERWSARFLASEALGLADRREFPAAVARLEEALSALGGDRVERARVSIDLAATLHHAGRPERTVPLLRAAAALASEAGREDLARVARGNLVQAFIDREDWAAASAGAASLLDSARSAGDPVWTLVALHHRSRVALRTGRLEDARRDNAQARTIAREIGDRLEIGELWLEDGDRAALQGSAEEARRSWSAAASDPPDRDDSAERARARLEELAALEAEETAARLAAGASERIARGEYAAAESVARYARLAAGRVPDALARAAASLLRARGGGLLADLAFGEAASAGVTAADPGGLRLLRDLVCRCVAGEDTDGVALPFGIAGLALRTSEREIVRLGRDPDGAVEPAPRTLASGAVQYELRLWPEPPDGAGDAAALVLETLLFRPAPPAVPAEFALGWSRLGVLASDSSMEEPYRRLARFAPRPITVLVLGESGSGKEAVARAVHSLSPRAAGRFVAVNVSAIPAALLESELFGHSRGAFTGAERDRAGLFEEAAGGTIFFDEIGDLAASLQAKLLRALQEGEIRRVGENRARRVDVRVVSATSRDLAAEVEAGRFREDLFYRLHVAVIRLPPLRERGRDVLLLARHFLQQKGAPPLDLAPEAVAALLAHPWPGNVRELQSAMASAAALADGPRVEPAHLPEAVKRSARPAERGKGYRSRVNAHRRGLIMEALDRAGGNRSRAARELQLSRQALLYLIRELGVNEGARARSEVRGER